MFIKSNFISEETFNRFLLTDHNLRDKNISIFYDYVPSFEELHVNPYNILILGEPNQLFGLHDWAIQNHYYFSCILTWGETILNNCSNALLFPFGTTFLHKENKYKELASLDKKFEISFLCGPKKIIEGHHLRQKIWNKQNEIKSPIKFIYEGNKIPCFEHNMFHIAVENSQNKNYFTEKIIDAFLTRTIPIYCGCPNIEEFFNKKGIITFNNENELVSILNSLTEEDYLNRKEYIEENYIIAIHYAEIFTRLKDILKEIIKLNNI
jgi:hypothetical protein